jgi:hypothetical protein
MNASIASNLGKAMASGIGADFTNLDSATAEKIKTMANPQLLLDKNKLEAVQVSLPEQVQQIFVNVMDMVRTAMGQALSWVFYIGALLLFVGVVLSLFLKVKQGVVVDTEPEETDDEDDDMQIEYVS